MCNNFIYSHIFLLPVSLAEATHKLHQLQDLRLSLILKQPSLQCQKVQDATRTRARKCAEEQQRTTMSHTQVRADEATTNHEENIYGLFSLSADAGMSSGSNLTVRHDWNRDPRHLLIVQVMESEPDNEANCERRRGETLTHTETVRQRGNSNARSSSPPGTNRGKATSMPVHNSQPRRSYPDSCR